MLVEEDVMAPDEEKDATYLDPDLAEVNKTRLDRVVRMALLKKRELKFQEIKKGRYIIDKKELER